MKHIHCLLILLFQSCCAMNSQQTPEGAFRQKLQRYLHLPNIETSNDLSEEEKHQYHATLRFGSGQTIPDAFLSFKLLLNIQATPPPSVQDVQDHVENIAKRHNIFTPLQAIVRCVNSFAKTDPKSTTKIFSEELNCILAQSWADLTKLPNKEAKGTPFDMVVAGLNRSQKDQEKGRQPTLTMSRKALLCHLLMAYAGSPYATFTIYVSLPHYEIAD